MVGVPRSKGCRTCLRRKIRCDQTKPDCWQCIRSRRQCGGYRPTFQFVSNKTMCSRPPGSGELEKTPTGYDESINYNIFGIQDMMPMFMHFVQMDERGNSLLRLSSYVKNASVVHSKMLLDCSKATSIALCAKQHNLERAKEFGRLLYSECVAKVQSALYDPANILNDDTLASILFLSVCEIITSTVGASTVWRTHVKGALELLRMGGPSRKKTMAPDLYDTLRIQAVIEGSISAKRLFLEQIEWKTHSSEPYAWLLDLMTELPGILEVRNALAKKLALSSKLVTQPGADEHEFNQKGYSLYQQLINWRESVRYEVTLVPGEKGDSLFPFVYEYSCSAFTVGPATLFCAAMILLADSLPPNLIDERYRTDFLCDEICKSVRFAKLSLGARAALIFPLSNAAYHLKGEKRSWAFSQLRQLGLSDFDLATSISGGQNGPYPAEYTPEPDGNAIFEKFEELR